MLIFLIVASALICFVLGGLLHRLLEYFEATLTPRKTSKVSVLWEIGAVLIIPAILSLGIFLLVTLPLSPWEFWLIGIPSLFTVLLVSSGVYTLLMPWNEKAKKT